MSLRLKDAYSDRRRYVQCLIPRRQPEKQLYNARVRMLVKSTFVGFWYQKTIQTGWAHGIARSLPRGLFSRRQRLSTAATMTMAPRKAQMPSRDIGHETPIASVRKYRSIRRLEHQVPL